MVKKLEEDSKLQAGHHFEFLDRVHIAEAYIAMSLGDHPMLERYPSLRTRYDQIVDQLGAMYQEVGQLEDTWK